MATNNAFGRLTMTAFLLSLSMFAPGTAAISDGLPALDPDHVLDSAIHDLNGVTSRIEMVPSGFGLVVPGCYKLHGIYVWPCPPIDL
jgi:hypothetical protein